MSFGNAFIQFVKKVPDHTIEEVWADSTGQAPELEEVDLLNEDAGPGEADHDDANPELSPETSPEAPKIEASDAEDFEMDNDEDQCVAVESRHEATPEEYDHQSTRESERESDDGNVTETEMDKTDDEEALEAAVDADGDAAPGVPMSESGAKDADSPLKSLLKGWNMADNTYLLLKEKGITSEDLTLLSSDDINALFSPSRTGEKLRFRHQLHNWPRSTLYQPIASSSKKLCFTKSNVQQADLENLLKTNKKGQMVAKHYAKHGSLNDHSRKQLSDIICDTYIADEKSFPVADMQQYSEIIATIFPTESSETYLCPRDISIGKNNPSGLLYFKYFNSVDRKAFVPPRQKRRKIENNPKAAVSQDPEELKSVQEDHAWLLNNNCPAEEVKRRWENTIQYRSDQINSLQKETSKFSKIVESWPRYKDKDGLLYIDIDYTALSGDSGNNLLMGWATFAEKFLAHAISTRIRNKASKEIIEKLQQPGISACSRNFLLYKLFPLVIKPKRIRGNILPSILQAQSDSIVHCITANDVGPAIEELKRNRTLQELQPTIIVVGAEDTQLTQFYVVKNDVLWKPCSFLKCIDVVVKTCRVFKLDYSPHNELFWVFIRTHFMNEEGVKHSKCSALVALQNILK